MHALGARSAAIGLALAALAGVACGREHDVVSDLGMPGRIIGLEDWDEARVARGDIDYPLAWTQSQAIALLYIDDRLGSRRCSGAMISDDLLLTAAHCFRDERGDRAEVTTVTAFFGKRMDDAGRIPCESGNELPRFDCSQGVDYDSRHDLQVLRCAPNAEGQLPGALFGTIPLSGRGPRKDEALYLLSVNDYDDATRRPPDWAASNDRCPLSVKLSPGPRAAVEGGREGRHAACRVIDPMDLFILRGIFDLEGFTATCDFLQGSSGGPVMLRETGEIVGVASSFDVPGSNHFGAAYMYAPP